MRHAKWYFQLLWLNHTKIKELKEGQNISFFNEKTPYIVYFFINLVFMFHAIVESPYLCNFIAVLLH